MKKELNAKVIENIAGGVIREEIIKKRWKYSKTYLLASQLCRI